MTQAPLLRLSLFRMDENDFRFVWTFHHILVDGRSRLLLLQEVFSRYEASKQRTLLGIASVAALFRLYPLAGSLRLRENEPYWRQLLNGYLAAAPLNLGGPRERSPKKSPADRIQEDRLSPAMTADLETFARENQLTLNTLIQGAWAFLLSRYTGEDDVVFGATRACRKSALQNSESMIGLFINTLPVRLKIGGRDTVMDCLKALRAQWVSLREYEHTPLSRIQSWSDVPSGQPLFDTIVVFENFHLEAKLRELGEEWKSRSVRVHQHTHYPLTLEVYAEPSLLLRIDYAANRFDEASVQRMLGHLKRIAGRDDGETRRPSWETDGCSLRLKIRSCWNNETSPTRTVSHPGFPPMEDATLQELFEEQSEAGTRCSRSHL